MKWANFSLGHLPASFRHAPNSTSAVREQPHAFQIGARPRQPIFDLSTRAVTVQDALNIGREALALNYCVIQLLDGRRAT